MLSVLGSHIAWGDGELGGYRFRSLPKITNKTMAGSHKTQ